MATIAGCGHLNTPNGLMGLFNIDISQLVQQLTPPKKRSDEQNSFGVGLLSAFKRILQTFLDYKEGSTATNYTAGTYQKYDRVIYNWGTYESLIDDNNSIPEDTSAWVKLLDSFIGVDESQYYDGKVLQLTYALNRYFGTTFNQPPIQSEIYLNNNIQPISPFRVGDTEAQSSWVSDLVSSEFVMYDYTLTAATALFTINVPIATYTALGADAEQIIRNFADKYVEASITYDIQTY